MLRIFLFLLTNLAVLVVPGLVLGVTVLLGQLPVGALLDLWMAPLFCLAYGLIGSFISLFLSKWMAKRFTKTRIIKDPQTETEIWLVNMIGSLARDAQVGIPEVGIFPARQVNAFATGWNRNHALVAVSKGLLQRMDRDEAQAVLAHEIGHIANGDMVTLAMIQGVVNTFVVSFARIIAIFVEGGIDFKKGDSEKPSSRKKRRGSWGYIIGWYIAQAVLGIFASMIVYRFSRWREFRADEAGAGMVGRGNMIAALQSVQININERIPSQLPRSLRTFGINPGFEGKPGSAGAPASGSHPEPGSYPGFIGKLKALFSTHPPIEDRIHALQDMP